jgi:hypothetical protein
VKERTDWMLSELKSQCADGCLYRWRLVGNLTPLTVIKQSYSYAVSIVSLVTSNNTALSDIAGGGGDMRID